MNNIDDKNLYKVLNRIGLTILCPERTWIISVAFALYYLY